MADHEKHVKQVFDRLKAAGLRLKPTKCVFGLKEVKLLGHVLDSQGIRTDPDKVSAIRDLGTPPSVTEVRSFLGMTGYYRQCVPNYAQVSEPLIALIRKHVRFSWDSACDVAFNTLKRLLISSHVMTPPDINQPYKLHTDACDYAIGGHISARR
jgi:hypothetical protein